MVSISMYTFIAIKIRATFYRFFRERFISNLYKKINQFFEHQTRLI